ncbi:MAG: hypothetical protein ABIY50_11920 [Ignavibacteria bacterium]
MDYSFKTDLNFIFIIAAIIISAAVSYFYYKGSKLENPQKRIFTVLRFLSVFFILLLLMSPVISYFKNLSEKPVNVFLIDNSESLLIENRNENVMEGLKEKILNETPAGSDNLFFLFSGNLYKEIIPGESEPVYQDINNFKSDLTSTLYSLQERLSRKNLSTVTVISDGILNEGGNPLTAARSLNVPFNYILTGDTIQKNDLVVKNLFFNKTSFIESSAPVNVQINSYGYDTDIKINLYEEDKLIDSKNLRVSSEQSNYNIIFNVISSAEAIVKYKVDITGISDEVTLKNNFEEFFIKFIDNKFKVLVLAGGPSADLAFLSEEIKKVKNFEATFLTQKSSAEFYEGTLPDMNIFNSFILIGYPTSVTNPVILNSIKENLDRNNSSLIFFASRNTDYKKLTLLEDDLPFKISGYSESEEETGIKTVSVPDKEIFKNSGLMSSVNTFPNIFKTTSIVSANPSSETFLLMSRNSSPALIVESTDKNRSAAFMAYGFYKWRLNGSNNNSGEVLNYILTSSLTAITDKEAKSKFSAETSKDVYSKFENVIFESSINNFELQGGERIKVKIIGNNFSNELELTKKGSRYFRGELNIPEDGNYEYTAELYSKNALEESIKDRFSIGVNNFEYKSTRADNLILSLLASERAGTNFTGKTTDEIREFFKSANEKSKSEYKSLQNYELNINPYYLMMVILLLCAEWFLRKRNNLP